MTSEMPDLKCGCEHEDHFSEEGPAGTKHRTKHAYASVSAGEKRGLYVGRICDRCAETCMTDYLI